MKNKYSIVSEIRQSVKGDYYLSYTVLRNGVKCEDTRLPDKVRGLKGEINLLCKCGADYGYFKTMEEILVRKIQLDNTIMKMFPNKMPYINPKSSFFNIVESCIYQ